MDLRPFVKSPRQRAKAQELVERGLLVYQPFILGEDLATGVGYEFEKDAEFAGLVYWPTCDPELARNPSIDRLLIDNDLKHDFLASNKALHRTYEHFVSSIFAHVPAMETKSFADFGCNSGYFPVVMAKRGVQVAHGFDREDYSLTFGFLNELLATKAAFVRSRWNPCGQPQVGSYDIVVSMMTVVHMYSTLDFLKFLGGLAREGLLVWTICNKDTDISIRFGEPAKYYAGDGFPYLFDNRVFPSKPLLQKSLELMGFSEIIELGHGEGGIKEDMLGGQCVAYLAIR